MEVSQSSIVYESGIIHVACCIINTHWVVDFLTQVNEIVDENLQGTIIFVSVARCQLKVDFRIPYSTSCSWYSLRINFLISLYSGLSHSAEETGKNKTPLDGHFLSHWKGFVAARRGEYDIIDADTLISIFAPDGIADTKIWELLRIVVS